MGTTTPYLALYLPADNEIFDEQANTNASFNKVDAGVLAEHNGWTAHAAAISPHTGEAALAAANVFTAAQTIRVAPDTPALILDPGALSAAGVQTSDRLRLVAHSYDTGDHQRNFIQRARTTTNAGTGVLEWLTGLDAQTPPSLLMSVDSGGNFAISGYESLTEIGTPATPPAGSLFLYPKADHKLYIKDSTGLEVPVGAGSAAITVFEAINVTGTTVTLPTTPAPNGVFEVDVNGQQQQLTRDWTISGAVITFTTALSGDDVHVSYVIASSFSTANYFVHYETTLAPGANTVTLPQTPVGTPLVTRGGVAQYQTAGHYTLSGTVLTLALAIGSGEDGRISVDYFVAGGGLSDAGSVNGLMAVTAPNAQPNRLVATDANGLLPSQIVPSQANQLVNGGFEIWQRGNGPWTANGFGPADRWAISMAGTDTISVQRNSGTPAGSGSQYSALCTFTLGTGAGGSSIWQVLRLSDGHQIAGRAFALSVAVNVNVANAVRIGLQSNGTGGTTVYSSYAPGTGNFVVLTTTYTVPVDATFLGAVVFFAASCTAYIDNAMLVVGSQPAAYVPLTPADDLARCQRYFETMGGPPGGSGTMELRAYMPAGASGTVYTNDQFEFRQTKAVNPTVTILGSPWSNSGNVNVIPSVASVDPNGLRLTVATNAALASPAVIYCLNGTVGSYVTLEANP